MCTNLANKENNRQYERIDELKNYLKLQLNNGNAIVVQ